MDEDFSQQPAHAYSPFSTDTGQGPGLDFSSFAQGHFFDDTFTSPLSATKAHPAHDDSCLDQPSCLASSTIAQNFAYTNPLALSRLSYMNNPLRSRHIMPTYSPSPPQPSVQGAMAFPQMEMVFHSPLNPQGYAQPQNRPLSHHQTHQRGLTRSASVSMGSSFPSDDGSRNDEIAANALIIMQLPTMTGVPHHCQHDTTCQHDIIAPESDLNQFPEEYSAWNHILSCHDENQPPHCVRPCPADNPQVYQQCHIPAEYYAAQGQQATLLAKSREQLPQESELCGVKFNDPSHYIHHFNQVHRDALPRTHEGESPSISASEALTPASVPVSSETDEVDHPKISLNEETQFMCFWTSNGRQCNMNFRNGDELQEHVKDTHLKSLRRQDTGYFCMWEGCGRSKSFAQKSKLTRHIQTHTGFKAEVCPHCNLRLSAKQSLNQHLLTHTGGKPWICDHPGCNARFRQQSALTMHKRTHTGEKPLKCDICGKGFSESSNLSKHRKIHSEELPLVCSMEGCEKAFRRPDQLRRHMESHWRKNAKLQAQSQRVQPYRTRVAKRKKAEREMGYAETLDSSDNESCSGDGECCFDESCEGHGSS